MKRLMLCTLSLAILSSCAYRADRAGDSDESTIEMYRADASNGGPSQVPNHANLNQDIRGRYEGLTTEAPLEHADLRIERSGWIRVDTKNELQASTKLRRMAAQFDATVMSFNDHAVSFKMPSARIETLLEVLEKTEGWDIDEFDFSAWDRTGEYYSVEARIESANAVKARLMKLLESAATVDEVLKIHGKLESVQKELDGYNGVMRDMQLRAGRVDVAILFD